MAGKIRHNYVALLVAAVLYLVLEAGWLWLAPRVASVGRSLPGFAGGRIFGHGYILGHTFVSAEAGLIALVSAFVIAMAISWITHMTGPQTALHAMEVAAALWFGLVLTTWATQYAFEGRSVEMLAASTGFPLLGMVVQGALIGGWKARPPKG